MLAFSGCGNVVSKDGVSLKLQGSTGEYGRDDSITVKAQAPIESASNTNNVSFFMARLENTTPC